MAALRTVTDLSAKGGGGLLAAALPGAVGAVNVVEAGDAALDAEVLVVVHAQLLCGQLLQAIRILGLQGAPTCHTLRL